MTARIGLELGAASRSRTWLSPAGRACGLRRMAGRISATIIPERSAIHGARDFKEGIALRALSDVTGMPQTPIPKIKNKTAYGLVNTPRPKKRRNLRARRAALMTKPERRTAMRRTKGQPGAFGAGCVPMSLDLDGSPKFPGCVTAAARCPPLPSDNPAVDAHTNVEKKTTRNSARLTISLKFIHPRGADGASSRILEGLYYARGKVNRSTSWLQRHDDVMSPNSLLGSGAADCERLMRFVPSDGPSGSDSRRPDRVITSCLPTNRK